MIDKQLRRAIQKADKYIRNRDYPCLVPNCGMKAIRSHSVPRAACEEALAKNGTLFARRLSLSGAMNMSSPNDSPDIVKTGLNEAGIFMGYCPTHDHLLFRSKDNTVNSAEKSGMFVADHVRAISLEFCRKRQVADFFEKLVQLSNSHQVREYFKPIVGKQRLFLMGFGMTHLKRAFAMCDDSNTDTVEYFCVLLTRNVQVSCCGCFTSKPGDFDSDIAYNLTSYADMSILVLSVFKAGKPYLDSFLGQYPFPEKGEQLINEIAFSHCEEPLISYQLWQSLNLSEKLEVQAALRHPSYRPDRPAPRIIKLGPKDFWSTRTPLTQSKLSRLPPDLIQLLSRLNT